MFEKKLLRVWAFIAFAVTTTLSANVSAVPIQFIYTGTGSGSIGSTSFNTAFTITEDSETGNLQSCGGSCNFIDADTTTINLAGIGFFTFTTGTRTFDNTGTVGFSRAGLSGADLYNIFSVGAAYDMISSIGPIAGTPSLLQWNFSPVQTNGGVLFFETGQTSGTFQAIAGANVPEPASLALLGIGLAGLVSLRRKKRA